MPRNSSIFSFESVQALIGLPRRTRVWYGLIVLTAAVLTVSGAVVFGGAPYKDPAPMRAKSAPLDEARVLLLGNSQYRGVSPDLLGVPAANYALAGSDYVIQHAIFAQLLPKMPKLEMVLVGFGNVPLRTPGIERREGDYRDITAMGVPWYAIPNVSPLDRVRYLVRQGSFLRPYFAGENLSFARLNAWLLPKAAAQADDVDFDPTAVRAGFSVSPAGGAQKMRSYQRSLQNTGATEANRAALFAMCAACAARNIAVALLRSPTAEGFWKARGEAWELELKLLNEELQETFPTLTLTLWDDETTGEYGLEWFNDPNHLTSAGFQRYAQQLAARIAAAGKGARGRK